MIDSMEDSVGSDKSLLLVYDDIIAEGFEPCLHSFSACGRMFYVDALAVTVPQEVQRCVRVGFPEQAR